MTNKHRFARCGLALGTLYLANLIPAAAAQAVENESIADEARPPPEINSRIEEIEVRGVRSISTLRLEIKREEEQMYLMFNQLNNGREFDVHCNNRQVTGTRLFTWECMPVYMQRAQQENVQDFLQFGLPISNEMQLWAEQSHKHEEFNAEMRRVAIEHPGFLNAVMDLAQKKRRLDQLEAEQAQRGVNGFLQRLFDKDEE